MECNLEATLSQLVLDEYISVFSEADRRRFRALVKQLGMVSSRAVQEVGRDQVFPEFLSSYCQSVAELFAATSVAIWFADVGQGGIQRRVDVGWNNLALTESVADAHHQLIDYAWKQSEVLAVNPFSIPKAGACVSNPTDSFLLMAPATYEGRPVAVLEIALGPKPLRRPHDALVRSYLPWLQWLKLLLERGMANFFVADEPLFVALQQLQHTATEVEAIQAQIVLTIQASLQSLAGQKFGSLAANQRVAKEVHALLDSKGLRVKCPECGTAAILRCQNSGNSKTGAFVYDHYLDKGRTFHGGPSSFPLLELIPKPPRRKS